MSDPDFETARALAEREGSVPLAGAPIAARDLIIEPVAGLEAMKKVWTAYFQLKGVLLDDPACYDEIAGTREMNRTGATRLATAFGLSLETLRIDEGRVQDADSEAYDYRFLLRVRASRGSRFADGIASCRLSEIPERTKKGELVPYSQREHFALTKAASRATKRAIADLLGGTEAE